MKKSFSSLSQFCPYMWKSEIFSVYQCKSEIFSVYQCISLKLLALKESALVQII